MRRRIIARVERLDENPRPVGAKQLVGSTKELRLRAGDYRVIYEVNDDVLRVLVLKVAPRKDVYRRR